MTIKKIRFSLAASLLNLFVGLCSVLMLWVGSKLIDYHFILDFILAALSLPALFFAVFSLIRAPFIWMFAGIEFEANKITVSSFLIGPNPIEIQRNKISNVEVVDGPFGSIAVLGMGDDKALSEGVNLMKYPVNAPTTYKIPIAMYDISAEDLIEAI